MFSEEYQPLDDDLPLFGKSWSENSGPPQFKHFPDAFAHLNDLELSRSVSPLVVPEHIPTGTEMTFNPYPSNTEVPLRPRITLKQFGKYAPQKRSRSEKIEAEFVEGSNNDENIADSTHSDSTVEHKRVELQRAQIADGAATKPKRANKRKQKEERKEQEQVAKAETRGRKNNTLLQDFDNYVVEFKRPEAQGY